MYCILFAADCDESYLTKHTRRFTRLLFLLTVYLEVLQVRFSLTRCPFVARVTKPLFFWFGVNGGCVVLGNKQTVNCNMGWNIHIPDLSNLDIGELI